MTQANEPSDTPTKIELKPDELAFIAAYFGENMNATRAYIKLHPKVTYESAKATASLFLTNVNVKAEIKRRLTEKAMSAEEALFRLGEMARAELKPFIRVDEEGFAYFNLADSDAREYLFLIKKMKTKRERRVGGENETWEGEWVEVELYDAQAALRDVLKMHGKFVDKVDVTSGGEKIEPKVDDAKFDRAILALTNALGEILSNKGTGADGALDTPEQTPMARLP
jgi:hypothetical protein